AVVLGDAPARQLSAPSARGARPRAPAAGGRHDPGGRETLVREQGAGGIRREQATRRRAFGDRPAHALSDPRAPGDRGRELKRALGIAVLVFAGAGCAPAARTPARGELTRGILAATAPLTRRNEGTVPRAPSARVHDPHSTT